jgi:GH15 family glucan-1,4-alpha-glucosidase
MKYGWNNDKQAFVSSFGGEHLDASTLIMPLVFFASPQDPKMIATLKAVAPDPRGIRSGGLARNGMILRYDTEYTNDSFTGKEGTFNICSLWYGKYIRL